MQLQHKAMYSWGHPMAGCKSGGAEAPMAEHSPAAQGYTACTQPMYLHVQRATEVGC